MSEVVANEPFGGQPAADHSHHVSFAVTPAQAEAGSMQGMPSRVDSPNSSLRVKAVGCSPEGDEDETLSRGRQSVHLSEPIQDEPIVNVTPRSSSEAARWRNACIDPAVTHYENESRKVVAKMRRPLITYERLFWFVWIVITVLWTLDRFTTGLWPRESFGSETYGKDHYDFPDGPWTVTAWYVCVRASGRICILAMNGLFLTMMPVFWNFVSEKVTSVNMDDWAEANEKIHKAMGYIVVAATMLHMWPMFLPFIFSGWKTIMFVTVYETEFVAPAMELKPKWCTELNVTDESMCIGSDDLGRFIGETIMLCVALPLTRWAYVLSKNYPLCMFFHVCIAVLYFLDMVRRTWHPHTWILNTPVFLMYLVDKALGKYYYRVAECELAYTVMLDDDYAVLFWKRPQNEDRLRSMIGDTFWVRATSNLNDECFPNFIERSHPFTTMNNHAEHITRPNPDSSRVSWGGHKFAVHMGKISRKETHVSADLTALDDAASEKSHATSVRMADVENWDTAAIVHVFDKPRCCMGSSHTSVLVSPHTQTARFKGPYRSVYSRLRLAPHIPPVVLIGSGSGGAYLMDFVAFVVQCKINLVNPVSIVYTSASIALFQFVTNNICDVPIENLTVNACLTSVDGIDYSPNPNKERDMQIGRMNITEILDAAPKYTEVYFCGSPSLRDRVAVECTKRKFVFHGGHAFA